MKCKECDACHLGWFPSSPNKYVCTGVREPFVIDNIDVECTEYPERRTKKNGLKSCPFCGGVGILWSKNNCDIIYAVCQNCGARTIDCSYTEQAVDAWNSRVE